MKRIMLAVVALLLSAGTVTAVHAATTATVPPGVRVSSMKYQPGASLPATRLPDVTPVNGTFTSRNWSGYADVACGSCALRYVAASFTLPSVNCANSPNGSVAAFFVALDGIGDAATGRVASTIEQIGATASCSGGTASYLAFYEMFPRPSVAFSGIGPGDAISAAVYFNGATNHWQLGLTDLTSGGSLAVAETCPAGLTCHNASAEVITEAPSLSTGGAVVPLVDFGQSNYEGIQVTSRNGTHGAMTSNGLWTANAIAMVGGTGTILARPGPVYGGQAFQDTWLAAQ
jgi:hypothetical protein